MENHERLYTFFGSNPSMVRVGEYLFEEWWYDKETKNFYHLDTSEEDEVVTIEEYRETSSRYAELLEEFKEEMKNEMTYKKYLRALADVNAPTEDPVYGSLLLTTHVSYTNYKGKAVYEAEAVADDANAIDEDGYTPRFVCRWYGDVNDIDWSKTDATVEGVFYWDGKRLER